MRQYFLTSGKQFYKTSMHMHTNLSDGKFSPEETKKRYQEQGYSVAAFTDHEFLKVHDDLNDDTFLAITAYEYDISSAGKSSNTEKVCHLNFYARDQFNTTQVGFDSSQHWAAKYKDQIKYIGEDRYRGYSEMEINQVIDQANKNGFIVCYNHPEWSNETIFDYSRYNGFFAMEVYNHSCMSAEGSTSEEWNIQGYDMLLKAGRRIYPIFADDSHNPDIEAKFCDGFGGYIMVNAEKLEYDQVFGAIERGDFYASMAPEIFELYVEDGKLCVSCSEAKEIRFFTAGRRGKMVKGEQGALVTYGEYTPCEDFGFLRVEIIDQYGRVATTRGYFADEFK